MVLGGSSEAFSDGGFLFYRASAPLAQPVEKTHTSGIFNRKCWLSGTLRGKIKSKRGNHLSEKVTIKQLLDSGAHFGHQTPRWNPKMKPFIFGDRNGIHIINLEIRLRFSTRRLSLYSKLLKKVRPFCLSAPKSKPKIL